MSMQPTFKCKDFHFLTPKFDPGKARKTDLVGGFNPFEKH